MPKTPVYHLGAPMWSLDAWRGRLLTTKAKKAEHLSQYASVFNTVEGNTTFYGVPKRETVVRWREDVHDPFRFCFKLPRALSHDCLLKGNRVRDDVLAFIETMTPIHDCLGQFFIQLPPTFTGHDLGTLEDFLRFLPNTFTYAIEPRHNDFFNHSHYEKRFVELLCELNMNRVLFDTVSLFALAPTTAAIREAQRKKPCFPERFDATGQAPFVRFVGSESVDANTARLTTIAQHVGTWINEGRTPYVFIHSPEDVYVPEIARTFHHLLQTHVRLPNLPPWPGETEPKAPSQLDLFR